MNAKKVRRITFGITSIYIFLLACIFIPMFGVVMAAIQKGLLDVISRQYNASLLLLFLGIVAISVFSITFLALILVSLFSSINLTLQGIEYHTVLSRGIIKPGEIIAFSNPKLVRSLRLLVIQRKGSGLFSPKGLLFQNIHGYLLGFNKPIIILWDNAKEIERLFAEMYRKPEG